MTSPTATAPAVKLTVDEILTNIAAAMPTPKGTELTVGDVTYTVLDGADGFEAMLGGKSQKGNGHGKLTPIDALILALESRSGPAAVYIAAAVGDADSAGFLNVTVHAAAIGQRAGRLALSGQIKIGKARLGNKYTGELRIAPADLVAELPKMPKTEDLTTARAILTIWNEDGTVKDGQKGEARKMGDDNIAAAIAVRNAANAQARLKIIQGTVACRWY